MSRLMDLARSLGSNQVSIGGGGNGLSIAIKSAFGDAINPLDAKLKQMQIKTAEINQKLALKRLNEDNNLKKELERLKYKTEQQRLANQEFALKLKKQQYQDAIDKKKEQETLKQKMFNIAANPVGYSDVRNNIGNLQDIVTEKVDEVKEIDKILPQEEIVKLTKQMQEEYGGKEPKFKYKKIKLNENDLKVERATRDFLNNFKSIRGNNQDANFMRKRAVNDFIKNAFDIDDKGNFKAKSNYLKDLVEALNKEYSKEKHKYDNIKNLKSEDIKINDYELIDTIKENRLNVRKALYERDNLGDNVKAYSFLKDKLLQNPNMLNKALVSINDIKKHNMQADENMRRLQEKYAELFTTGKEQVKTGKKVDKLAVLEVALGKLYDKRKDIIGKVAKQRGITSLEGLKAVASQVDNAIKLEENRIKKIYKKLADIKAQKAKELERLKKMKDEAQIYKAKKAIDAKYDKEKLKLKDKLLRGRMLYEKELEDK